MNKNIISILLAFFIAIIGLIFLIYSIVNINRSYVIIKNGVSGKATVYKIERRTNSDMDLVVFFMKFNYNNKLYTIRNSVADSDSTYYKIGQEVPVAFLTSEPEKAVINNKKERYEGYIFHLSFGTLFVFISAFVFKIIFLPSRNKNSKQEL